MHKDLGERVNSIKVKGKPIDLEKSYTVVACEREGDPEEVLCRIENVSGAHNVDGTLHEIMREYLAKFSPVAPKVEGRITATDAPATLLSQLEGYDYDFI
ncbi:MAG: hypothetical protein U5K54_15830 [Cytophagales bacterium]|nr:hypothetical protein [Cytophagales bacterium]